MKRTLYLLHRWLGIALCLFMALWFVSGVVMMYVGYPKLSSQERLSALPPLEPQHCCNGLSTALTELAGLADSGTLRSLRLTTLGKDPALIAGLEKGRYRVFSTDGSPRGPVTREQALATAQAFRPGVAATYLDQVEEDAWSHSKALDSHRPLHRVALADADETWLYLSGSTGEVVRDASATERTWNWLGAWLHWLYPLRGGLLDAWWTDIVITLSVAATVLGIVGLWVGILRWRRRPYASGSRSPYRNPWMRWHHWLGLGFGLLSVTWIASGLFSVNPWKMFDSAGPRPAPRPALSRPDVSSLREPMALTDALGRFHAAGLAAKEVEWTTLAGRSYLLARDGQGHSQLLDWPLQRDEQPFAAFSQEALALAGQGLLPGYGVVDQQLQADYDWHYYARAPHSMTGHMERPLPVLRLTFDDPAHTWLYLDPASGAVVHRLNDALRLKRWLFALLHSWDWRPLLQHRPVWDVLLIGASLGGFLLSLSGAVIGFRRLRRPLPRQ
ncbi:hypothetical protein AZSI13_11500 [Azospira sp. I13]|uniref:PepSY domain-containing protein n=1 Tax=Azospira sp. I13 TaxID=1765050 RepID=UPI000D498DD6|nr:PepSY domain-containing protein [Azospira sp. I13]GBG01823.1 hypothetical protein AZSI13_11500 [Azospira sp. I13]